MSESEVNESLRAHVTRVGFDLTLGKTHIAALVWIDLRLRTNVPVDDRFHGRGAHAAFRLHVTGTHGLIDRGLVEHIAEQRRKPGENLLSMTPRRCWRITRAGRLVIDLLKEAGIYQEYAALIPIVRMENTS